MDTAGFRWAIVLLMLGATTVCEAESLPLPIDESQWL
jgi:hypothetical protein